MKLASCKSALNPTVVYSTDRSKAVDPVLSLTLSCFVVYSTFFFVLKLMCHTPTLLSWSELTEHSIGRKKEKKKYRCETPWRETHPSALFGSFPRKTEGADKCENESETPETFHFILKQ